MGSIFDIGLMSQVTAPQEKLPISGQYVNLNRKVRHDERKKGGAFQPKRPPSGSQGPTDEHAPAGVREGNIDITI